MNRSKLLLAGGLLFGLSTSACMVHGSGGVRVHGAATTGVVVYEAPPQDKVETHEARPGFVWIRGRWDWRNGKWAWVNGRWERERAGKSWRPGRWERQGNQYVWIQGEWVAGTYDASGASGGVVVTGGGPAPGPGNYDASGASGGVVVSAGADYPTAAPPAPRTESYGSPPSAGFIWIAGHWDWKGGQWAWINGHWDRPRANMVWEPGRWEHRGQRWVWTEGRWVKGNPGHANHGHGMHDASGASGGVVVSGGADYPTAAPPPAKTESYGSPPSAGFIWIAGHWDWKGRQWVWINGHWDRPRANMVWQPGRWEHRGQRWVWTEGRWVKGKPRPVVRDHR